MNSSVQGSWKILHYDGENYGEPSDDIPEHKGKPYHGNPFRGDPSGACAGRRAVRARQDS